MVKASGLCVGLLCRTITKATSWCGMRTPGEPSLPTQAARKQEVKKENVLSHYTHLPGMAPTPTLYVHLLDQKLVSWADTEGRLKMSSL